MYTVMHVRIHGYLPIARLVLAFAFTTRSFAPFAP